MLTLSLRNLLVHKLRLLLTVATVAVGVAFVSGTFVLSDTMNRAFDELYSGLSAGTDVAVRSESAFLEATSAGQERRPLDQSLVTAVSKVPGVAVAEGTVTGFAIILDKNGTPIQPGGAPTLGANVDAEAQLNSGFTFRDGRAPREADEVVLDAQSAAKADYRVGDRVGVVLEGGKRTFGVVGILGFGKSDSLAGATLAGFDTRTAQQVLGKAGLFDEIDVRAEDGVSSATLRTDIAATLPSGTEAVTGEQLAAESSAAVRDGMGAFTQILLGFAGVSLLVGSFVIWNTFNILVAQRRREVALLRAVGGTRRQVLGGVLGEAALVGLLASGVGLLSGVGLAAGIRALLKLIGIEIPSTAVALEPRTVIAALAVGLGVTLVAAFAPAWAATRVAPMEALRDATLATGPVSGTRRRAGWVVTGAGIAGLVVCAVLGDLVVLTAVSSLVAFAGLVTIGPSLAQAVARVADHGPRGGGWRLASRNIARAPRRAAATALALTMGLAVVSAVAVTATSLKASVASSVTSGNRSDLILRPASAGGGISPSAAGTLRGLDAIATVEEVRYASVQVDGVATSLVAMDPSGRDSVVDLDIRDGHAASKDGEIMVRVQQAQELGLKVGDPITVTFAETGPKAMTVAATFADDSLIGSPYVISLTDFTPNVSSNLDVAILLKSVPGADPATAKVAVTGALVDYPNITVSDPAEMTEKAQASVDQMLGLVTALLLLAVIVAVLGIVNTLVLSVLERTRELGLMRAVGATQSQVRTIVRRESVLMAVLGAVTGVALGALSGIALSRALVNQGINTVAIPMGTLAIYLLLAVLVGIVAAIGPARRAAKVDVLRAVLVD